METIIVTMVGFATMFVQQWFKHKQTMSIQSKAQQKVEDLITTKDKEQDKKLQEVLDRIINVESYTEELKYKNALTTKIANTMEYLINNIANSGILYDSEMIILLNNIKINYLKVINNILITNISELNADTIKSDIITFAKGIRHATNFNNIDVTDYRTLIDLLKIEIVEAEMNIFIRRLEEEILNEKNKFNGTFEKLALSTAKNLINGTIRVYTTCKERELINKKLNDGN